jgi:hypothetical protein
MLGEQVSRFYVRAIMFKTDGTSSTKFKTSIDNFYYKETSLPVIVVSRGDSMLQATLVIMTLLFSLMLRRPKTLREIQTQGQ